MWLCTKEQHAYLTYYQKAHSLWIGKYTLHCTALYWLLSPSCRRHKGTRHNILKEDEFSSYLYNNRKYIFKHLVLENSTKEKKQANLGLWVKNRRIFLKKEKKKNNYIEVFCCY